MSNYILKKDGMLYNKETGKQKKEVYIRKVPYYSIFMDGKQKMIQIDPWYIMKEYNISEYNIEIDNDVIEDEMFMKHIELRYKRLMLCYNDHEAVVSRLWKEILRDGKEYIFVK